MCNLFNETHESRRSVRVETGSDAYVSYYLHRETENGGRSGPNQAVSEKKIADHKDMILQHLQASMPDLPAFILTCKYDI